MKGRTAKQAYQENQQAIKARLENISILITTTPDRIHWGHVADLGYANEQLAEIEKALGISQPTREG